MAKLLPKLVVVSEVLVWTLAVECCGPMCREKAAL